MLKKKITFENFEGETVTEEFLFHISKADLIEIQMNAPDGDFEKMINRIVAAEDAKAVYEEFKKIIRMSVGKKSDDGKRFLKTDEIREDFMNSDAYAELVLELLQDPEAASNFVNAIVPKMDVQGGVVTQVPPNEVKKLTQEEMTEMDPDELKSGLATGKFVLGG